MNTITIDDLSKVLLKVVHILNAERVEGSDKLLKLIADDGEGERQIIAGIGKSYEPAELIGKNVVIVANLEPRMVMGLESQGMILAASSEEGPIVLSPEKIVPAGAMIK